MLAEPMAQQLFPIRSSSKLAHGCLLPLKMADGNYVMSHANSLLRMHVFECIMCMLHSENSRKML